MTRFFTRDLSDDHDLRKLFYTLAVDGAGTRRVVIEEWNDFGDTGRMSPDSEGKRELSETEFRSEFAHKPEIIASFEQAIRDRQS